MNTDLKKIKKMYGEKMMHFCREHFPTLLEKEGLLFLLLESNFAFSKNLYDDIIKEEKTNEFIEYIYSLTSFKGEKSASEKTPFELMDDAGYTLYECKNEEDIQSFKKYYVKDEELCTFRDNRLESNYVFFAVKKNVDDIKRECFKNPDRQDDYGTSVISIQFSKDYFNTISIKNRYNHTVFNPDATFSNNLDNIIPGLTDSFIRNYNFNLTKSNKCDFELRNYVKANDEKLYKYNYEINNIYYCPNNIIINNFNVITKYKNKEKYLVFDYFILDLENKELVVSNKAYYESFFNDFTFINKIDITNNKQTKGKTITILFDNDKKAIIELDKENKIIKYYNDKITKLEDHYLEHNIYLKEMNLPNVLEVGNSCLENNIFLERIGLDNVIKIGDRFLEWNSNLKEYKIPNLKCVGSDFLKYNRRIETIFFENLEIIGDDFFSHNHSVKKVILPNAKIIKDNFVKENKHIKEIAMPEVLEIGDYFLCSNYRLKKLNLPKVKKLGKLFLNNNNHLEIIKLPNVNIIGDDFLYNNNSLLSIDLPLVKEIGNWFLFTNKKIEKVSLPSVVVVGDNFLTTNEIINEINMPEVKKIGYSFLKYNLNLKEIIFNEVQSIGKYFLYSNICLNKFVADNLQIVDDDFLSSNDNIMYLSLPNILYIFNHFLEQNNKLIKFDAPNLKEVGDYFLYYNTKLNELNIPKIKRNGSHFLTYNKNITEPEFKPQTLKKTL